VFSHDHLMVIEGVYSKALFSILQKVTFRILTFNAMFVKQQHTNQA